MESRTTTIAKNLALTMVYTAAVFAGSWVLSNSFLAPYWAWIVLVGYQVLIFALTLALVAFMLFLACAAVFAFAAMVKAIFRRKKNDDD